MADIMPPPTPEPREPWSLVDGCPNCVTNVEPPFTWDVTETETRCSYICRDCRHIWSTSWSR